MAVAVGGPSCPPPLRPRLSAVPDFRHLETLAGALGRPPCQGRPRHHARRSLCRGLRSLPIIGFADARRSFWHWKLKRSPLRNRFLMPAERAGGTLRPPNPSLGGWLPRR